MHWIVQAGDSVDLLGDPAQMEVWENAWRYWAIVALNAVMWIVLALVASHEIVI